jgi:hypothetical protein
MGAGWELLAVSEPEEIRKALDNHDRQPFWLLEHDPIWHSALLTHGDSSVTIAKKNGACLLGLLVHSVKLPLRFGDFSVAAISVRRHVLTGGFPGAGISVPELEDLLVQLAPEVGPSGLIFLQGVHEGEPLHRALASAELKRKYYVMLRGRSYQRCRIALEGDLSAYLDGLRSSTRKDLRRTLRRFDAHYAQWTCLEVIVDPDALEQVLPELIALSDKTYHGRVLGLGPAAGNYVVRQMRFAARHGILRLDLLRVQGRLVSFQVGYVYGNVLFATHAGYDPDWSDCSPGIVHLIRIVEDLCRSRPDVAWLDFMYGDEPYKRRLGNRFHVEFQFYLIPKSARGFATWLALRAAQGVSHFAGTVLDRLNLKGKVQWWLRRVRAAVGLRHTPHGKQP